MNDHQFHQLIRHVDVLRHELKVSNVLLGKIAQHFGCTTPPGTPDIDPDLKAALESLKSHTDALKNALDANPPT